MKRNSKGKLTPKSSPRIDMHLYINSVGSFCPVPSKAKINAALGLFGMIYFVLLAYTVLRNVFYNKIE